jgi:hypothetical protein
MSSRIFAIYSTIALLITLPTAIWADDCNQNGVDDDQDIASGNSQDCNLNNIPDECEISSWIQEDFDGSTSGNYVLHGVANLSQEAVNLTSGGGNQANGWANFVEEFPTNGTDWRISFAFRITGNSDLTLMALYDSLEFDSNLHHQSGSPWLELAFDHYQNSWDPNGNHVDLNIGSLGRQHYTPSFSLENGLWNQVTLECVGGLLSVQLQAPGQPAEHAFSGISLPARRPALSNVAFTAITGGNGDTHWIDTVLVDALGTNIHDCDSNGVLDSCDILLDPDLDCDNNGILDACDITADPSLDCGSDGLLDSCQLSADPGLDCDGNGVMDVCDMTADPSLDCDHDGALDSCQLISDPSLDCDGSGVLDSCEIAADSLLDQNTNGILDVCECVATNYCLASNNTSGNIATISANGSHSLTLNAFTLEVQGAAIQKFGLFFYGATQAQIFLGEGMLCISAPIQRLQPVLVTDAQGAAVLPLDFTMPPFDSGAFTVNPFSTWNFQFWFRDPLGGPAGFNFSDGLEVTFCP